MGLTRDEIFTCNDRNVEEVSTPEWGGSVYVLSLDGTGRDEFEAGSMVKNDKSGEYDVVTANLRARLVSATVCDADGNLLFTPEDVAELGQRNSAVLSRIYDVAARLAGITKADLDELVKNSEAVLSASSTSE